MRYLLVLMSLSVIGCGQSSVKVYGPDISSHLAAFERVSEHPINNGIINFVPSLQARTVLGQSRVIAGLCHLSTKQWTLEVNQSEWDKLSENGQRTLIFHELTHCVFNRAGHSKDPQSYMYDIVNFNKFDPVLRDKQLKEIADEY